jgi:hypothetical protein
VKRQGQGHFTDPALKDYLPTEVTFTSLR